MNKVRKQMKLVKEEDNLWDEIQDLVKKEEYEWIELRDLISELIDVNIELEKLSNQ